MAARLFVQPLENKANIVKKNKIKKEKKRKEKKGRVRINRRTQITSMNIS